MDNDPLNAFLNYSQNCFSHSQHSVTKIRQSPNHFNKNFTPVILPIVLRQMTFFSFILTTTWIHTLLVYITNTCRTNGISPNFFSHMPSPGIITIIILLLYYLIVSTNSSQTNVISSSSFSNKNLTPLKLSIVLRQMLSSTLLSLTKSWLHL